MIEILLLILFAWIGVLSFLLQAQASNLRRVEKILSRVRVVKKPKVGGVSSPTKSKDAPAAAVSRIEMPTPDQKEGKPLEFVLVRWVLPTVGVMSVLLGLSFLFIWSYRSGWIDPKTLMVVGALASALVVCVGEYVRPLYPRYHAYLTAVGATGLVVCVYTAQAVYGFISAPTAFVLYVAVQGLICGLAWRYNNRTLSFLSVGASPLVPLPMFLYTTIDPSMIVLMSYAALVFIVAAYIMRTRGWTETMLAALLSLVVYAFGLFDVLQGVLGRLEWAPMEQAIHALGYLLWLYGACLLLGWGIVARTQDSLISMRLSTCGFLLTVLNVHVCGWWVFKELEWENFGLFLLVQGLAMFLVAKLMRDREQGEQERLFMASSLLAALFATLYEIDYQNYSAILTLILAAQSLFCVYMYSKCSTSVRTVWIVFALITQLVALGSLALVEGFVFETICYASLAGLALYNARVFAKERDGAGVGGGAIVQGCVAIALFAIWNYTLLGAELGVATVWVVPYALAALVVSALSAYWCLRRTEYILQASIASAVGNMFVFVGLVSEHQPVLWYMLGGFALSWTALLVPVVATKYARLKVGAVGIMVERITVLTTAGSLLWLAHWALEEPGTTVSVALVAVTYVVIGLRAEQPWARRLGIILMSFVVGKLYLVDMWNWSIFWKFMAFLPVGFVLISLPFWYHALLSQTQKKEDRDV